MFFSRDNLNCVSTFVLEACQDSEGRAGARDFSGEKGRGKHHYHKGRAPMAGVREGMEIETFAY